MNVLLINLNLVMININTIQKHYQISLNIFNENNISKGNIL